MRRARPARCPALGRIIADVGVDPARPPSRTSGSPAGKIDVVPLEAASPTPTATPTPEPQLREKFGLGDRPVLLSVSGEAPAQEPPAAARRARADPRRAPPAARAPRLRDAARGRAARPRRRARHRRRRRLAAVAGEPRSSRASTRSPTPSCSRRCTRASGCPCSRRWRAASRSRLPTRGSLAEVAGDAALIFEPENVDAIRDAIERLLGDAALAERLRDAGRAQAASFSWERCAELTAASYERTLAGAYDPHPPAVGAAHHDHDPAAAADRDHPAAAHAHLDLAAPAEQPHAHLRRRRHRPPELRDQVAVRRRTPASRSSRRAAGRSGPGSWATSSPRRAG